MIPKITFGNVMGYGIDVYVGADGSPVDEQSTMLHQLLMKKLTDQDQVHTLMLTLVD